MRRLADDRLMKGNQRSLVVCFHRWRRLTQMLVKKTRDRMTMVLRVWSEWTRNRRRASILISSLQTTAMKRRHFRFWRLRLKEKDEEEERNWELARESLTQWKAIVDERKKRQVSLANNV